MDHSCSWGQTKLRKLCFAALCIGALTLAGCGGNALGGPPVSGKNTNITLLLTSTANGRYATYSMNFTNITLTNKAGRTVTLLSRPRSAEFIHLNGISEPLLTVSVPQDTYTSASITSTYASFAVAYVNAVGPVVSHYVYMNYMPYPPVVNLPPSGLTISGANMALSLDLLVSQSATLSGNYAGASYTINPTFYLNPVFVAEQPTNFSNGKMENVTGSVHSINRDGFALCLDDDLGVPGDLCLTYNSNTSTVYQGVSGLSSLSPGMSVNMDAQLQKDGTLLVTRVYVPNPQAADTMQGMLFEVNMAYPIGGFGLLSQLQDGEELSSESPDAMTYGFGSQAIFKISPAYANLSSLPFPSVFDSAANMAIGQDVSASSAAIGDYGGGNSTADTVTLMPQTINGTVISLSQSGNYSIYTVDLASNDSIVELGGAKSVVAYSDSNTQMLNNTPIAAGSVIRFYGLLFNDNGILRMDCAQIMDGVPE